MYGTYHEQRRSDMEPITCDKIMTMDNETEEKVKAAPPQEIAEGWPAWVVELAGSWSDDDFPTLEEIRAGVPPDLPREPL